MGRPLPCRLAVVGILSIAVLAAPLIASSQDPHGMRLLAQHAHAGTETAMPSLADLMPVAPVTPLHALQRPDVLVTASGPLSAATIGHLIALAPTPAQVVAVRVGTLNVSGTNLTAWGVDPSQFRAFAPAGTAEADGVWESLTDGDLAISHATAETLEFALGSQLAVTGGDPPLTRSLRLGSLATSGLPGVSVLLSDDTASSYGFPLANAVVLSGGQGDPKSLALAARRVVGSTATVRQLSASHTPVVVLRGGPAAQPFGSFSYRYFANGTIVPDPAWVRANIVYADVPILGRVQCHRLVIPQLRAALAEVQLSGLAGSIYRGQYAGCYNPRFIDRNPAQPVSLHTWGIALDLNVPGNQRGTAGQIDRRVVAIFKRWGFAWGGDWAYTDPMHFELSTLVTPR